MSLFPPSNRFRLPPAFPAMPTASSPWLWLILCALFLLPGLVGHDPWKSEDATHIGVVHALLKDGHWLVPHLAGEPYAAANPLFYWTGALVALVFGWLPEHDAIRLVTGGWAVILLLALSGAAQALYGREQRRMAVLILLGCLGLMVHLHETQPAIAVLACQALACWGAALMSSDSRRGGILAGLGVALGFLAGGMPALALTVPLLLMPVIVPAWRTRTGMLGMAWAVAVALPLLALWPWALWHFDPAFSTTWWHGQMMLFAPLFDYPKAALRNMGEYLALLAWFAWPALPLSLWTLWRQRKDGETPQILLPLTAFFVTLVVQSISVEARSQTALPFLVPLALLAVPASGTLRRGAANALDWFGMMTFTLLAFLVWLGWVAMVFQVPAQIAKNAARLEPGFTMPVLPLALACALIVTLAWLWFVFTAGRSPQRGTINWSLGVACLWCLLMALWLPGIDYGKSYRKLAHDLMSHLPTSECVASRGLGTSQRASLDYFVGLRTHEGAQCAVLLVLTTGKGAEVSPGREWRKVWEGRRAGDRHEHFRLYRRQMEEKQ